MEDWRDTLQAGACLVEISDYVKLAARLQKAAHTKLQQRMENDTGSGSNTGSICMLMLVLFA